MTTHCVLRSLDVVPSDRKEFVPLRDVASLAVGETIFVGDFTSELESGHGPSGSHSRTVCLPVRRNALREFKATACVFRDLGDGTGAQYVPVSEVQTKPGERMIVALFSGQRESGHGPSGSHARTVCLPVSRVFEMTVPTSIN